VVDWSASVPMPLVSDHEFLSGQKWTAARELVKERAYNPQYVSFLAQRLMIEMS
jgi:hypothetical protein